APDPLGLAATLLGDPDQARVGASHLLGRFFAFAAREPMDLLRQPPHTPRARPERLPAEARLLAHDPLGPPEQPAEDPHAITEQAAIGGMVDRRPEHRAIHPQLPPARDL